MQLSARAERWIEEAPERVFAFITAPDAPGRTFRGFLLVPGAAASRSADERPLREGSLRLVTNEDGSVVTEEILEVSAPLRQRYRLVGGLPPLLSRLVTEPAGSWTLSPEDDGTRIVWRFYFPLRGVWAAPLVWALSWMFQRAMGRCLELIARQLEEEREAALPPPSADEPIELPVDGVLDLHLFSPKDIKTLVPDYLEECHKRGITAVRIIHGKGTGALRKSVHALLERSPLVESFGPADITAGGWGATLVDLKANERR